MKKQNLLVGLGAFSIGVVPILSVVSCNNNEFSFSTDENIFLKNIKIILNEQGREKTVEEFLNEGWKDTNWINVLNKYTNWNEVVTQVDQKGLHISIDSVKEISNGIEVNTLINGKPLVIPVYGFKTTDTVLADVINNFKLTIKQASQGKTAEEIANEFINSNQPAADKGLALLNNFNISNSEVTIKDGMLVVNTNSVNEEIILSIESVSWNAGAANLNEKGNQIIISLKFSYLDSNNQVQEAYQLSTISGFTSYETKFNNLVTDFENNTIIVATRNESLGKVITASELIDQFNKATTDEARFNVLKDNTNIETIPAFDKSANLSYSAKVNQNGLTISPTNDTVINAVCSFEWNGMKKENINLNITQFRSNDPFVNKIEEALRSAQLQPTSQGKAISSIEVANKFKENPESLGTYVNLDGMPNFVGVVISYKSAIANDQENVPVNEKGTTLSISGSYTYNGVEREVTFKKVVGFASTYSLAEKELNQKVNAIQLTSTNTNVFPSEINTSNWKSYFAGIPEENDLYFISNVVINANDKTGIIGIQFDYNRRFENEVITKTTKLFEFKLSYEGQSTENFQALKAQMQNNNYFDTIIKEGESKSNYFTSYFGSWENKVSTDALKNLFNIPDKVGVEFKIYGEIRYSKTDSSLSDTQLRIPVIIRDKVTSEKFVKEFIVDGFMDPFGMKNDYIYSNRKTVRSLINQQGNDVIKFNNPYYQKYKDVPEIFKHQLPWANNYATWQTTWLTWGIDYPAYDYIKCDTPNYINEFLMAEKVKFPTIDHPSVDMYKIKPIHLFVKDAVKNIFKQDGLNDSIEATVDWNMSVNNKTFGLATTLNKDQDGIVRADVTMSVIFKSKATDKKGNKADYKDARVDNLYFFIYWKNGWWK